MTSILDPMFGPPGLLPFSPGTSAFHQKGNGYIGDLEYFDGVIHGGANAVISALPQESQRAFYRQPFSPSGWYDIFPGAPLHEVAARLRRIEFAEHRRQVGAWHARVAAGGIYRALLRAISNENIAVWAPRVSSIYFDFGKTETRSVGRNEIMGFRRGLPAGLVQFVLCASQGFAEETLRLAGAQAARFEPGAVVAEDRAFGQQLYTVPFTIHWR